MELEAPRAFYCQPGWPRTTKLQGAPKERAKAHVAGDNKAVVGGAPRSAQQRKFL